MKPAAVLEYVSQNVRAYRSLQGLSQQQLADLAGLSRRMIAGVESGQDNISLAKLSLIADALGVDFAQIIAAPEQQGHAVINALAWRGAQEQSVAKLLASAPAAQRWMKQTGGQKAPVPEIVLRAFSYHYLLQMLPFYS